jgi:glycosyltransferase involved in cell wall biosynthesis
MKNKKKLLWLSHLVPYPPKGGVLQRSYYLLSELSREYEIHLVSFIQKKLILTHYNSYDSGLQDCKDQLGQCCDTVEFFEIPQEVIAFGKQITGIKGMLSRGGYTVEWLKSKEMNHYLQSIGDSFDVVHFDTISLAIYRKHFPDTHHVIDHHNIESHMLLRRASNESNLLKKIYFYWEGKKLEVYETKIVRDVALNITCSDLDTLRLKNIASSANIETVPNGVDTSYFSPKGERKAIDESDFRLVFAGRLNAYTNRKAVDYIEKILWPIIRDKFPGVTFDLVGQNPPPETIKALLNDKKFNITGYVDDVRPYLDKADIYICPIEDGGGTKLKILDALAMGIPIIANPIACEGINVVDNESVLYATDSAGYIKCIETLLLNDKLYTTISNNGIRLIKDNYTFRSIGNLMIGLYRQLTS